MIFFAGIYYGAMYGGSTTSILLNTPGETGTMVTALEGFKMAKSGRAGAALATSAIGSFVAGTIATVLVTLFAPLVAEYAVQAGPPEYFMLMVLAFTTVSAVLGKSTLRGMTALFVGLAIGLVGMDQITGQARYTGGRARADGRHRGGAGGGGPVRRGRVRSTPRCTRAAASPSQPHEQGAHDARGVARSWPAWLRGTALGFPFGTIPAGGTEIPTFLSYGTRTQALASTRRSSAPPGAIEGVAGPEAANNAAVTATLVPLLTLGIPTSVTAAILLSALQNYGINAGPQLFQTSGRWCGR
jgi:putative tricarboxylic transport membrane protein